MARRALDAAGGSPHRGRARQLVAVRSVVVRTTTARPARVGPSGRGCCGAERRQVAPLVGSYASYSASTSAERWRSRSERRASSMTTASGWPFKVRRALAKRCSSTVVLTLTRPMPQSCPPSDDVNGAPTPARGAGDLRGPVWSDRTMFHNYSVGILTTWYATVAGSRSATPQEFRTAAGPGGRRITRGRGSHDLQ